MSRESGMFTGVRAICSCGAAFPLPREAFETGTVCPGCGGEVTREELTAYRPPGVTVFTRKSSIIVLCLLVLGHVGFLARVYFNGTLVELGRTYQGYGRRLPALTTLVLGRDYVPPVLLCLGLFAIGISLAALLRHDDQAAHDMEAPAFLLTTLTLAVLAGSVIALAIRWPLIDLIRSLY